ncbi:MAG: DUF423 domain-containing protein [Sediminibacterium sp.]|nr:DUF423 domain-containing protein [Sediminibacterium sp.]
MHKEFLTTAAILGGFAVLLGAFGAHGLKAHATEQQLNTYETAVRYMFYHVFALALCGVLYQTYPLGGVVTAGKLFMAGMAVFSGSLFLMTALSLGGSDKFKWLGAITPVGGLLLVAAWFMLAYTLIRHK